MAYWRRMHGDKPIPKKYRARFGLTKGEDMNDAKGWLDEFVAKHGNSKPGGENLSNDHGHTITGPNKKLKKPPPTRPAVKAARDYVEDFLASRA